MIDDLEPLLEPLLEPYRTIDLITESNEAIKLDATSTLLVDAKGCTDQDNSDLEATCNRTYPKLYSTYELIVLVV